ncbi:MAG: transketolase [Lachnospiraceae bacterium]|nr:transketolase [Lachnospiraceae bacterium]
MNNQELRHYANEIRKSAVTAVYTAHSGHPGGSLSCVDILTYLYFEEMHIDPKNPADPDRDRFVLSKGHVTPALYGTMAHRGYFPLEELKTFRQLGTRLHGHPSMRYLPGLDMSTGSLGQGMATAVGMALAGKVQKKDYRVYTVIGDGESQEGEIWEAAMFAAAKKLDNLTVILDYNGLQIDGTIAEVNDPQPFDKKFEAFGFHVVVADGHDFDSLRAAFEEARKTKGQPTVILAKTVKGKGVSFMENQAGWHGKSPNEEQYRQAMEELERAGEANE